MPEGSCSIQYLSNVKISFREYWKLLKVPPPHDIIPLTKVGCSSSGFSSEWPCPETWPHSRSSHLRCSDLATQHHTDGDGYVTMNLNVSIRSANIRTRRSYCEPTRGRQVGSQFSIQILWSGKISLVHCLLDPTVLSTYFRNTVATNLNPLSYAFIFQ